MSIQLHTCINKIRPFICACFQMSKMMFIWRFWKTAFTGASTSRATVGFGAMAHIPIGKDIYQYCSVISSKISIFNEVFRRQKVNILGSPEPARLSPEKPVIIKLSLVAT